MGVLIAIAQTLDLQPQERVFKPNVTDSQGGAWERRDRGLEEPKKSKFSEPKFPFC